MGRPQTMDGVEQTAWRNLLLAHSRVLARLDADLTAECDMTIAEYEVLQHLLESSDHRLRMNELAELARLSPSGLTRRFDALVRRGWVVRERCDEDRRGVLARLTPDGLGRIRAAAPVHDRGERAYFGDVLTDDELTVIATALERVATSNDPEESFSGVGARP